MKFDKIVKWRIETKANGSFEDTKNQIQNHINNGRYIFTYVTKHPKYKFNYISKVRSGVFYIAKELNILRGDKNDVCLTGSEFDALSKTDKIKKLSGKDGKVFSRVEPRHKRELVKILIEMVSISLC